jgi:hypothetical protein
MRDLIISQTFFSTKPEQDDSFVALENLRKICKQSCEPVLQKEGDTNSDFNTFGVECKFKPFNHENNPLITRKYNI